MADLLVKLYNLPDSAPVYEKVAKEGVRIFRPMTPNRDKVLQWIEQRFGIGWANETAAAFTHTPVSCFIAVDEATKEILGFAAYDCTAPDFFGPTGVDVAARMKGIGGALLLHCLEALREEGYGYAIIGSAGPVDYYRRVCGAEVIPDSTPGIYRDLL